MEKDILEQFKEIQDVTAARTISTPGHLNVYLNGELIDHEVFADLNEEKAIARGYNIVQRKARCQSNEVLKLDSIVTLENNVHSVFYRVENLPKFKPRREVD